MEGDGDVVRLRQPDAIDDPLTEEVGAGARRLTAPAVELEVESFLAERAGSKFPDGGLASCAMPMRPSATCGPGSVPSRWHREVVARIEGPGRTDPLVRRLIADREGSQICSGHVW